MEFRALINIDIRNAFNTARWNICIEAVVQKKIPDYLLRMIDDYLSDRWVINEGDKWFPKEEMTNGAPQGSRVGPLVWNVMNDDFLQMVNSKLLYAAPVWTSTLNSHATQKKLFSPQRGVVLRVVSAYRTVSKSALLVLASVSPIYLLAEERKEDLSSP